MDKNNTIKWAIMCTGWGKNAKDVIEALSKDKITRCKIQLLVYENEPCGAKEAAEKKGVEVLLIKRSNFPNMEEYQKQLLKLLKKRNIDCIFLMNYKYKIRTILLHAFPNRIYNVHPSLFPSFLGTKTAIQDALDYGVKVTGITTHIIDHELDKGIILQQKAIKIKATDTFKTLYPKFVKKGKKLILKTIKNVILEEHKLHK